MIDKLLNFEGYVCPFCGAIDTYDFTAYDTHRNHYDHLGMPCYEDITTPYCPECNDEVELELFDIDNPFHLYAFAKDNNMPFVPKRLVDDSKTELDKAYAEVTLDEFLADMLRYNAEIEERILTNNDTLVVYYYI